MSTFDYYDYVKIYNVQKEAEYSDDDTDLAKVTAIKNWINTTFSDVVEAVVYQDNKVIVYDKNSSTSSLTTLAGFGWGEHNSSYKQCKFSITPASTSTINWWGMTVLNNGFPYNSLGLFYCKTASSYVMDFINLNYSKSNVRYGAPWHICADATDPVGDKTQVIIGGYLSDSSTSTNRTFWNVSLIDSYSPIITQRQAIYFLGARNDVYSNIILSKFSPYGTNVVCDNVYVLDGSAPAATHIFELNGDKYLCLSGYDYDYDTRRLAIKLDNPMT